MRLADLEAAFSEVAAPPAAGSPSPLPCRELASSPISPRALRGHLASLPAPPRTVALVNGEAGAMRPVEEAVVKWAHARARSLAELLRTGEVRVAAYRPGVAALTGLGPGLTPTGDDLLVGMAAMARRLGDAGLVSSGAADAFASALTGLASTPTTAAALALLSNASKGLFPSVLSAVVERLGDPDVEPGALVERVGRLTSVGAHSGADLLAGVLVLGLGVVSPGESA